MGCSEKKLSKNLTQTFMAYCNVMIYQQATLSGDAERLKVADAVIEAQIRPFRECRDGCKVCESPDPASYRPAVRVIEGIKEIVGGTPRELMFDVLMKVLFDRSIGLFA